MSIDTRTSTASATAYQCNTGDFLLGRDFNVCGGYSFGPNTVDDSTATWNSPSLTLGGDDVFAGGPRTISGYDFQLMKWDGMTLIIGNGLELAAGGEQIRFSTIPVPAAVWLFGSVLGLLGWVRRKAAPAIGV